VVRFCGPTASAEVESVATPEPFKATAAPIAVPLLLNVTVPVGVPATAEVTVAVSVTVWPKTEGFGWAVSAVVLVAPFTTCGFPVKDPVLVLKLPSPL